MANVTSRNNYAEYAHKCSQMCISASSARRRRGNNSICLALLPVAKLELGSAYIVASYGGDDR